MTSEGRHDEADFDEAASPIQAAVASLPDAPTPNGGQKESSAGDEALGFFQEDYSSLTLLDLAVVVEAHFDLWRRKLNLDTLLADTKSKARELQTRTQEASKRLLHKAENLTSPTQGARDNDDGATTNESGASTKRVLSFKDMANLPAAMSEQFQDPSGKLKLPQSEVLEREVARFRQRISNRAAKIQARWDDARLVSLRDKVSFLFGVMNVVSACLMVGFRPHWVPWVYTIQAFILLPWRAYSYKKKKYHYFLLDSCYAINLLAIIFIWITPGSRLLFEATFALTHGPLLAAVAAWRNSLVFHSLDKVTSLFIHVYPALCMTTITHFTPDALDRYPAVKVLDRQLNVTETFLSAMAVYLTWQGLYWRFVLIARRKKIQQGGRITSFTYMLNASKGWIGKALSGIKPQNRETAFMFGQSVFTVVTMAPVPWIFSNSLFAGFYLILIFGFATWNGAAFYIDVYLQKELKKMRQELEQLKEDAAMRSSGSSMASASTPSSPHAEASQGQKVATNEVPELNLGDNQEHENTSRSSDSSGELVEAHPDDYGHIKSE